jgi:hypothetical protein
MEGYCSTGQTPQWAVVPMEEEEEEEDEEEEGGGRRRRRRRRRKRRRRRICKLWNKTLFAYIY